MHCFQIAGGRLQAGDAGTAGPDTQIEGDDAAWIAALGPGRDFSGLRVAGQRQIAERILGSLPNETSLPG